MRLWARSLAGVTDQLVTNDQQVRTLLQQGPDAANEVSQLLNQIKPTLPVLLANMTTVGQVAVTYRPSLEQALVLLPPFVADVLSSAPENNPTGIPLGDFRISIADPNPVHGRIPAAVPMAHPRRPDHDRHAGRVVLQAPTGFSDRRAWSAQRALHGRARQARPDGRGVLQRQALSSRWPCGSTPSARYPIDPNLIAQGIPPDNRVTANENLFAPVEGTPPPPGAAIPPGPPGIPPVPPGIPPTARAGRAATARGLARRSACRTKFVRRRHFRTGPVGGDRALRSADRPVRHPRWHRRPADRPRRPAEVVAGLDLPGGP